MSISRRSLAGHAWNKFRALWKGRERQTARRAARSAFLVETLESRVMMAGDLASALLSPDLYGPVSAAPTALSAQSPFTLGEGEQAAGEDAPDLVAFAKALTAAGANFYGAAWNADTTAQKALFEDGSQFLPFVEATNPDRSFNPIATGNNITTLPTWVFANQTRLTGVQSLAAIASAAGITIPTSSNPFLAPIGNQTVLGGAPLWVGLDGYDPNGGTLTYTATSSNPGLLQTSIPSGNRSAVIDVDGYGKMTFELFDNLAPDVVNRFVQLVNSGFYNQHTIGTDSVQGSGTATSFAGSSALSSTTDFYQGNRILFTSGALAGQSAKVQHYNGTTKAFTFASGAFTAAPAAGDSFQIIYEIDFHRVVPNFVIQAGDPTSTGSHGSTLGTFDDQFSLDLQHTSAGLLSMAKSTDDTNDSQFFVTDTSTRGLDFNHSIFGRLIEGESVRDAINSVPGGVQNPDQPFDANNNPNTRPLIPVVIKSITIVNNDVENGVLELKAAEGASGSATVTVKVTDADNHSTTQTITVNVTPDTSNGAPFLNAIAPIHTTPGQAVTVQLAATDAENNPNYFDAVKLSGETVNYTIDVNHDTGVVTITPPAGFTGAFDVLMGVRGATTTDTFDTFDTQLASVTVGPSAPTVDLLDASDSGVSNTDNITKNANVDFLISGVTSGATVKLMSGATVLAQGTASGSTITLTNVAISSLGQGAHAITALQTISGTDSPASAALNVTFDSVLPTFTSTAPSAAQVGIDVNYNAQSAEEGTTGFQYALVSPPTGASINATTGVLTWIPASNQTGTQAFSITATDAAGNSTPQSVSIEVGGALVDLSLKLTTPGGAALTSLGVGQDFVLHVSAQDLMQTVVVKEAATGSFTLSGGPLTGPTAAIPIGATSTQVRDAILPVLKSGVQVFVSEKVTTTNPNLTKYPIVFSNLGTNSSVITVQLNGATSTNVTVEQPHGVFSAYLDVAWDSTKAIVTGPITYSSSYTSFQQGNTATAGLIDEGGATAGLTELGAGPKEVFSIPMRSLASGNLTFTSDPADVSPHNITVFATNRNILPTEVHYGTASISVATTFNAVNDTFSGTEDTAQSLTPLANDTNVGSATNTLTIAAVGTPDHGGTVTISADGKSLSYTPAANFAGAEVFTYTAKNQNNETGTATITVNVANVNDPPTAVNDTATAARNSTANVINVLANDTTTPDTGETLRVTAVGTGSAGGTITVGTNGANVLYTPKANFTGTESFSYTISDRDSGGLTKQALVTVTVSGLVANNDNLTANEDSTNNVLNVLSNDTLDQAGGTLTITSVGARSNDGAVTIASDGKGLSYTPKANFQGVESFTYSITDGLGHNATGTATVTVANVNNDAPTATNDSLTAFKNTPISFDVLANDSSAPDPTENLVIDSITQPAHGTLTITDSGKKVSYTPTTGFSGTDSFTYTIKDPGGLTATATGTINVQEFVPSSLAGFVYFDVNNNGQKDTGELPIVGITITLTGRATGGAADITPLTQKTKDDGSYKFENLAPGTYTITQTTQPAFTIDGKDTAGSQGGTAGQDAATKLDTITITNMAQATTGTGNNFGELGRQANTISIRDFFASTSRNHTYAALNSAGVELWHTLGTPAWDGYSQAAFSLQTNNTQIQLQATNPQAQPVSSMVSTTSNKVDLLGQTSGNTFYRFFDGPAAFGFTPSTPSTPTNQAPTGVADTYSTAKGTTLTIAAAGVLSNDTDPESNSLTAAVVTQPAHGTLTLNSNGSFTYVPATSFTGADSFTYKASDGTSQSAATTVTINVTGTNTAPTGVADSFTTQEDTSITVSAPGILSNDTDPESGALTATVAVQPAHGTLTLNSNGSFTYVPAANFNGTDSFVYRASDPSAAQSAPTTVTLTVTAVNDAPVASPEPFLVTEDTPLTIGAPGVLANDTDVDQDTLTPTVVTQSAHGSVVLNSNGSFTYTPAANYSGPDSFSYKVNDGHVDSATAVVSFTISAVNDTPIANDDNYSTNLDTTLTIGAPGFLVNDSDPDGNTTTASLNSGGSPTHGTLEFNPNGNFTYTPDSGFHGVDSFTYTLSDGLLSDTATVTITVNGAPTAANDTFSTSEDTTLTIAAAGVLTNDTDPDGDSLAATLVAAPASGTLSLGANGSFTYIPNLNFHGTDSFTYTAGDGLVQSAAATVTITVNPANDAPSAIDDSFTTASGGQLTVAAPGILTNDTDLDGDALSASLANNGGPAHGSLSFNASGSFTYTPDPGFHGVDSFVYVASDGSASDSATVTINVNDPPVAVNDTRTTAEDTALTVAAAGVLANDTDSEGDSLTASLVTLPASGTLTLGASGSFTYTPAANFNGAVSFAYRANDGHSQSLPGTVTINVTPVNDDPLAANDTFTLAGDPQLVVATPGVLSNDTDPDGDPLTASLDAGAGVAHGSLSFSAAGDFTYTPDPGFHGVDSFRYAASDGHIESHAVVTIHVNLAPSAVNDSYTATEDTALTFAAANGVLNNDTDPDSDPLTAALVDNTQEGTVALNSNGSFTYTPSADFHGAASFTYRASDGTSQSNLATVTITVDPVNDAPHAVADSFATDENSTLTVPAAGVLSNDTDVDGTDTLTATVVANAQHGTLTLAGNGSFTYVPASGFSGTDSFSYQVNDGHVDGTTAVVTLTVNPVNDAPVATNDSFATNEDTPLSIPAPGVLENDTDADLDTITAVLVDSPASGALTLNADGSLLYTPVANFHGTVSFTYKADDGAAQSGLATTTITVNSVNDSPQAAGESYFVPADSGLGVTAPGVLANDTDADGDSLTAGIVVTAGHGTLTLGSNGSITYAPEAGFTGPDSFSYQAHDGIAVSPIAVVTINVHGTNDAPVAADNSYTATQDTTLIVPVAAGVLANDTDANGDTLFAIVKDAPAHGTLTLGADGHLTYVPTTGFTGTDSFTYKAGDGNLFGEAAVTITVEAGGGEGEGASSLSPNDAAILSYLASLNANDPLSVLWHSSEDNWPAVVDQVMAQWGH